MQEKPDNVVVTTQIQFLSDLIRVVVFLFPDGQAIATTEIALYEAKYKCSGRSRQTYTRRGQINLSA